MDIQEDKLIVPDNFSLVEYLNYGSYSVVSSKDRDLLLKDWAKLTREEKQRNLSVLQAFQPYRKSIGIPTYITCGYRSERHELTKGRSGDSQHLLGAVDFTCLSKQDLEKYAHTLDKTWYGGFKHYIDQNFIHIDLGRNRRW